MGPSIVMATFDRSPKKNYVRASIEGLYEKDSSAPPMTLLVGSPEVAFLGPLATDNRVTVVPATDDDWAHLKGLTPSMRASWNLCRALAHSNGGSTILLEDDLTFSRNWYDDLSRAGLALAQAFGPMNLLSGYRVYDSLGGAIENGGYARFPGPFYASLCVLLVSDEARIRAMESATGKAPFDLAIGQSGLGAWSTGHSVVDHAGDESTLGLHAVRRAFDFRP
jgi:hypothetical protein